jgi:hypothetical protein
LKIPVKSYIVAIKQTKKRVLLEDRSVAWMRAGPGGMQGGSYKKIDGY